MASSDVAARLTEGHRIAQARLGAQTVQLLRSSWPLLDATDLDATIDRWLRVSVPVVQRQRRRSSVLASQYLQAFRAAEIGVDGSFVARPLDLDDTAQIITSFTVTGPVTVKEQMKRLVPLREAMRLAEAKSSAAGMRHALDGGRSTILDNVRRDRLALGHARAVSGDPCAFCAMLASRGPVYKDDSFDRSDARFTGSGEAKVHDGCSCSLEPVYRRDAAWPPGSERYRDLWQEAKRAPREEGETRLVFRRLVESGA